MRARGCGCGRSLWGRVSHALVKTLTPSVDSSAPFAPPLLSPSSPPLSSSCPPTPPTSRLSPSLSRHHHPLLPLSRTSSHVSPRRPSTMCSPSAHQPTSTIPLFSNPITALQHGRASFVFCASHTDDMLSLHDTATTEKVVSLHVPHERPTAISVSHDGIKCAFGTSTGAIYVWDALTPSSMESFRPDKDDHSAVIDLAWHPRGHVLAVATEEGALYIWDLVVGALLYPVTAHQGPMSAVRWTADGKLLVTAGRTDAIVRLWNPRNVENLAELSADSENSPSVKWHNKITAMDTLEDMSRVAITGGEDGSVLLSVFKPEALCGVFHSMNSHKAAVSALCFAPLHSPKPLRAASAAEDGSLNLFDMDRRLPMGSFDHQSHVKQVQFAPNADVLFSAAGSTVMAWDARVAPDEEIPMKFEGHPGQVHAFALVNEGRNLVTACEDGALRTFDLRYPADVANEEKR